MFTKTPHQYRNKQLDHLNQVLLHEHYISCDILSVLKKTTNKQTKKPHTPKQYMASINTVLYTDFCLAPDLRVNYIPSGTERQMTQGNLVLGLDSTQPPLWRLGFYIISDVYFSDAFDPFDRVL